MATLLFGVSSKAGAQTLLDSVAGLTVQGSSFEHALQLLSRSDSVSLVNSPALLPRHRLVACACARVTVGEALQRILRGTGLTFRAGTTNVRIVPARSGAAPEAAGTIVGRVVGGDDEPVVNVVVQLDEGRSVLFGPRRIVAVPGGARRHAPPSFDIHGRGGERAGRRQGAERRDEGMIVPPPQYYDADGWPVTLRREGLTMLPLLPTLGFRCEF